MNLCFALLGIYVFFIFALHGTAVPGLCATFSALLHYFMLVTFMAMAAEALNLYIKLVIVLGKGIQNYVWKAIIVSWSEQKNYICICVRVVRGHQKFAVHLSLFMSNCLFFIPVSYSHPNCPLLLCSKLPELRRRLFVSATSKCRMRPLEITLHFSLSCLQLPCVRNTFLHWDLGAVCYSVCV